MLFYAQLMLTEINECNEVLCSSGGTCIDKIDSYVCLCVDGYEGHTCDMNKNDCNGYPCLNGGTCQDEIYGYQCSCAFAHSAILEIPVVKVCSANGVRCRYMSQSTQFPFQTTNHTA